jgi:hypothetical protein
MLSGLRPACLGSPTPIEARGCGLRGGFCDATYGYFAHSSLQLAPARTAASRPCVASRRRRISRLRQGRRACRRRSLAPFHRRGLSLRLCSCAAPWRTSGPLRHTRVLARVRAPSQRGAALPPCRRARCRFTSRSGGASGASTATSCHRREARTGGGRRRIGGAPPPLGVRRVPVPGALTPTVHALRRSARRRSSRNRSAAATKSRP